jgi:hypothetical protein
MRKVLITCRADEREVAWWDLWKLARGTFIDYSIKHHYEYREFWYSDFEERRWPGVHSGRLPVWPLDHSKTSPCWLKIPAIAQMLERFDLVVYLDNDCVILDHSKDIAEELPADKWLAMHDATTGEGCGPNVGVVVCRSLPIARKFWREAWDIDAWKTAKWTDNGQVMSLLGYTTAPPLMKVRDTEYTDGYHVLGEEWNGYGAGPGIVKQGCRIFHAAWGRDGAWKLGAMKAALKGAVNVAGK